MKPLSVLLLLIVVALIVAACGSDTATPTIAPTEALDEVPTEPPAEETPAPTEPASPLDNMESVVDPDLVDIIWEWFQRTTTEATEVLFTVPNLEDYTLLFNADQTFGAQLDCNNASGAYATDGAGIILMELGPMTAVACPPETLSDEMLNMFGPA